LSAADSTLLAHLDERVSVQPTALARHLGISPSTLSAAVKRLTAHGYIVQQRADGDGRVRAATLDERRCCDAGQLRARIVSRKRSAGATVYVRA
jgi:DNA-binding MarR family transcriptional regulator